MPVEELKEMLEELRKRPKIDVKELLRLYKSLSQEERSRMAREALETYISMHENRILGILGKRRRNMREDD